MDKRIRVEAVCYIEAPWKDLMERRMYPERCEVERQIFREKASTAYMFEHEWRGLENIRIQWGGRWLYPQAPSSHPPGYWPRTNPQYQTVYLREDD